MSLLQEHSKQRDVRGPSPLNYDSTRTLIPPIDSHDLFARSSVAVALWKAMVESRCWTKAIDKRNADGDKSTKDLTPSPPHRTSNDAWDQESSIRSTLRLDDSASLYI